MKKSHIDAFNKAYLKITKSDKKRLLFNEKTRKHDVVIPLRVIIKEISKFIDIVEKDLKIGKYKPLKKRNERSGKANR